MGIGARLGSFGLRSLPVLAGEQFRCSFSDHYARRHSVGRRYPRHDGRDDYYSALLVSRRSLYGRSLHPLMQRRHNNLISEFGT